MGRRGPRPEPTRLKLLKGNPGKRPLNAKEPRAPSGHPSCPPHLGRVAKAEWRRIVPILAEMGLLSKADRATIAAYCQTWQRWQEAERAIDENGLTMITDKGFVMQRPEVAMARQSATAVRQMAAELGLTPSARSRVEVPDKAPVTDRTEDLLFGRRPGA